MKNILEFNDPLYEVLRFGNVNSGTHHLRQAVLNGNNFFKLNKLILPIINCPEVARLKHLKQAGFVPLVFPSANHTRFAHSLGSFHLGQIALNTVSVFCIDNGNLSLLEHLQRYGLIEEFLVGLFLHDLGHYPFSHTLENNIGLKGSLGNKFVSHEEVACQLIMGAGDIFEEFEGKYFKYKDEMVAAILKKNDSYDLDVICFLISGNKQYFEKIRNINSDKKKQATIKLLHNLVSGDYDFDRIDHYRRDSFFTGLGHTFKPYSLLSGLEFSYEDSHNTFKENHSHESEGQIATMLFIRNQLHFRCFGDLKNISYSAMLNHALTMHLKEYEDNELIKEALYILTMTDSELLFHLEQSKNNQTKELIEAIILSRPYKCVASFGKQGRDISSKIIEKIYLRDNSLIVGFSKYFDNPDKNWLLEPPTPHDEKRGYIFTKDKEYDEVKSTLEYLKIKGISTPTEIEENSFCNFN